MSIRTFPALGYDPAPGDPGVLAGAARRADAAARTFSDAAGTAARLDSAGWEGDAAEAFRTRLRDLPRDLRLATSAHGTVARTLADYGDGLAVRQRRASELERRADELRRQRAMAVADVDRIAAQHAPHGSTELASLGSVYSSARARAEAYGDDLDAVLADARRLRDEHRTAARTAALRIRAASTPPYQEPGRLDRVLGAVKRWIAGNADVLTSISTVLRGVSAGLGVLSLVPGFQFLAPFAVAAAGFALLLDVAVETATGRGSWADIALDAVLTAVPAGPVARAVRSAPGVAPALKAANRAIPAGVKGRVFRAVRNLPEEITRDQLAVAAGRIRARASHLGDDVVVQGSRAGHSAHPGSDIDFGIRVAPERYDELIREYFGDPAATARSEAMVNAIDRGRIFWHRAGLKDLHHGLQQDLGRKVDLAVIKRGGLFDGEPWLPVR